MYINNNIFQLPDNDIILACFLFCIEGDHSWIIYVLHSYTKDTKYHLDNILSHLQEKEILNILNRKVQDCAEVFFKSYITSMFYIGYLLIFV
jgi:hypothetical protein